MDNKPIEIWNKVVRALLEAKEGWKELQLLSFEGINTENLPIKAQKFLGLATIRADFETAVERLMHYYRTQLGGLEELLIEQPPEDDLEGKEKKDGRRKRKERRI